MTCIAPRTPGDRVRCPNQRASGSLFCAGHAVAPAVQRGGWISAHARRQKRANHELTLDASNVFNRLWVGSRPPDDRDLPMFDVIALCAMEYQPPMKAFHGLVLRCRVPDDHLTAQQIYAVTMTATNVAAALARRQRCLVTCYAGLNRSALVASLALGMVTRMSADELIALMRARRDPRCLFNDHFRVILSSLIGPGRIR